MERGGTTYYYTFDGLGSVSELTDGSQSVVESYKYDAFGNLQTPPTTGNPYTYTAREYDAESGLYFYRARYYDAGVGRFLSIDPLLTGQIRIGTSLYVSTVAPRTPLAPILHPYTYVSSNPVNLIDPTGLIYCVVVDVSIGGAYFLGASGGCTYYRCKTKCGGWQSIRVCYVCLCGGMGAGASAVFGGCVAESIQSLPGFSALVEGGIGFFSGQFTTNFKSAVCGGGGVGVGFGGWGCLCYGWSS